MKTVWPFSDVCLSFAHLCLLWNVSLLYKNLNKNIKTVMNNKTLSQPAHEIGHFQRLWWPLFFLSPSLINLLSLSLSLSLSSLTFSILCQRCFYKYCVYHSFTFISFYFVLIIAILICKWYVMNWTYLK